MKIIQAPSISDLFLFWMIRHAREKEVRHSNPKFPQEGWNRSYKENKNFGTKPSYSPALPLLCVAKKEQTRRFQWESFSSSWKLGVSSRWCKTHSPFAPTFPGRCSTKLDWACAQRVAAVCSTRAGTLGFRIAAVGPPSNTPRNLLEPGELTCTSQLLLSLPLSIFSLLLLQHNSVYI